MTGKQKGSSSSKSAAAAAAAAASAVRQSTFFISGEGIDREVITADICRYLGNDALVKPGVHQDNKTGRTTEGFYITAYRAPTTAQLADLRADSQKWREERARNSRSQVEYKQSATQEQVRMREDPRSQGVYQNTPTTYDQMSSSISPTMGAPRPGDYGTARVSYQTAPTMMAPPAVPYNRNPSGYQPSEQPNYTYTTPPTQPSGYNVMDTNRDRMEVSSGQPPWNMQPSSGYQPSGAPPVNSGYSSGRPTYSYPPAGGNPSIPPGYGRGEPPSNYDYGPRDSGLPQPDPQENYYGANDEELMDADDYPQQPQATTQAPPRRDRERDSRERHEESSKRRHHRDR